MRRILSRRSPSKPAWNERVSYIYILWKWIEREDQNDIEWKIVSEKETERERERDREGF